MCPSHTLKASEELDPYAHYLSIGDAAKELSISRSKISRAMTNGQLPYQHLGRDTWRWIKRTDLHTWAGGGALP